jgi:hypothetical protein
MADNFDLKKFLKESKALENLNPSMKSINENNTREGMKAKIKDMIVAELDSAGDITIDSAPKKDLYDIYEADKTPEEKAEEDEALLDGGFGNFEEGYPEEIEYEEDNYDYSNDFYDGEYGDSNDFGDTDEFDGYGGYDLEEAKKKDEEVEDVEVTDTEEEMPADEEMPAEETPATGGGLEDIAADMKGTEADLMDNLMKAFQIAKGMGNEKLETQVGNTLKFFVSEYIGGGE